MAWPHYYRTCYVFIWIMGLQMHRQQIPASKSLSTISLFLVCYPVTLYFSSFPGFSSSAKFCSHCFFLSISVFWLVYPRLSLLSSTQRRREKERTHHQKAVESYCAGGRQHVEDQTILIHYSANALSLSRLLPPPLFPPSSFTKSPSISSVPPTSSTFSDLFAFAVSRDVSLTSPNSPATL